MAEEVLNAGGDDEFGKKCGACCVIDKECLKDCHYKRFFGNPTTICKKMLFETLYERFRNKFLRESLLLERRYKQRDAFISLLLLVEDNFRHDFKGATRDLLTQRADLLQDLHIINSEGTLELATIEKDLENTNNQIKEEEEKIAMITEINAALSGEVSRITKERDDAEKDLASNESMLIYLNSKLQKKKDQLIEVTAMVSDLKKALHGVDDAVMRIHNVITSINR